MTDTPKQSLTPVGDYLRKRYPPNDGTTHWTGSDGDPGCCAGPHATCTYGAAFREGAATERERIRAGLPEVIRYHRKFDLPHTPPEFLDENCAKLLGRLEYLIGDGS